MRYKKEIEGRKTTEEEKSVGKTESNSRDEGWETDGIWMQNDNKAIRG